MRVVLTVECGELAGRRLWIQSGGTTTVGRTESADFVVSGDRNLSSAHFEIRCDRTKCQLRDLNSRNGTYVNGKRVSQVDLATGDRITAGTTQLLAVLEQEESIDVRDAVKPVIKPVSQAVHSAEPIPPSHSPAKRNDSTVALQRDVLATLASLPITTASRAEEVSQMVLHFADQKGDRRSWLRPGQSAIVGRCDGADVLVVDDELERFHFAIDCQWSICRLRDLDSQSGTKLNGRPIRDALVYDGDVIQAGKSQFTIRIDGGPAAPSPNQRSYIAPTAPTLVPESAPSNPSSANIPSSAASLTSSQQSRCPCGLMRTVVEGTEILITDFIQRLSTQSPLRLLVHPLQVPAREDLKPPAFLRFAGISSEFDSHGRDPFLCTATDRDLLLKWIEVNGLSTGTSYFFSTEPPSELARRLQNLARPQKDITPVRKFSVEAVVAVYDTRVMSALLQHAPVEMISELVEACEAILLPTDSPRKVELFSKQAMTLT